MRIIAVDPGIANVGVALYPDKTALTVTTDKADPAKKRLTYLISYFVRLISSQKPDLVITEDFNNFGRQKNVDSIGKLLGAIIGMCAIRDIPVVLYKPNDWLKILGLDGEDHKKDTHALVTKKRWDLDSQHAADAAGMIEAYLKEGKNAKQDST